MTSQEFPVRPTQVNVVRYIRPDYWYTENDNMYGITIVYVIDYNNEIVTAKWSICQNDNFEKQIGRKIALNSDKSFQFPLDHVDYYGGLSFALFKNLASFTGISESVGRNFFGNYHRVSQVFLKATRML